MHYCKKDNLFQQHTEPFISTFWGFTSFHYCDSKLNIFQFWCEDKTFCLTGFFFTFSVILLTKWSISELRNIFKWIYMENNCSHNPSNVPRGTETDYEIIISATFMSILQKSMQEKKYPAYIEPRCRRWRWEWWSWMNGSVTWSLFSVYIATLTC